MSAMKKVWSIVRNYKKLFIISIIMMLLSQALALISPLIVKAILDDHIKGIENPWYEYDKQEKSVFFDGKYYIQSKYLEDSIDVSTLKEVRIFQIKDKFYYIDERVEVGSKYIEDDKIVIETKTGEKFYYDYQVLSYDNIIDFYTPSITILIILLVCLFLRSILSSLINFTQRFATANITIYMTRDARLMATRNMERLPISYFEREPAGKTSARLLHDVNGMMQLFSTLMNLVINASFALIFAYIGMFILDFRLALMSLVVYPFVYVWMKFFVKKLRGVAKKVSELNSLMVARINEIINGISILQIFNYKKQTIKDFNKLNDEFMHENIREVKLHITIGWNMINLLRGIITAIIVLYFGLGEISFLGVAVTAGTIYAYNEYILKIIDPISVLFREVGNLQHAIVRTERIFSLIEGEKEDYTLQEIPRYQGKIEFQNVSFKYNEESGLVLKNINLTIDSGQMIGLVGHTGSGKSSLMSLLLRFYDLNPEYGGKILIDDLDITTYSKRTYRKHIGIILQEPILFRGTIKSNVEFGVHATDEEVIHVLESIGAKKIIDKFEKGIHQEVTRNGLNMSVGEKQLISFARALLHDPSILIMDEATANIDTETETMIQRALEVVSKDRTMIVIAHRLSTIKHADKIIILDNGYKVEEGKHGELLALNGHYANIYRSQIKNVK